MPQSYEKIKGNDKVLMSFTTLKTDEFTALLAIFTDILERFLKKHNFDWTPRKRTFGFKTSSTFKSYADMLLFILTVFKTNPIQEVFAKQNGMTQPQVSEWVDKLEPHLTKALKKMNIAPERNGARLKYVEVESNCLILDATERPILRPKDYEEQREFYSGKKNTTQKKIQSLAMKIAS